MTIQANKCVYLLVSVQLYFLFVCFSLFFLLLFSSKSKKGPCTLFTLCRETFPPLPAFTPQSSHSS